MSALAPCSALLVALTLAGSPLESSLNTPPVPGGPSVHLQLTLQKTRFTAAEDRDVRIQLRNGGPTPFELPDPFRNADQSLTYTLTGPEHPDGYNVTWLDYLTRDPTSNVSNEPAPRIRLSAGQTLEHTVSLHELAPATRPGHYRLTARLTTEGRRIQAPTVEFDIVPSTMRSASLGMGAGANFGGIAAVWLQEVDGKWVLMEGGFFDETEWDGGTVGRRSIQQAGSVGAEATDALATVSNDLQGVGVIYWSVWREGASLRALAPPATTEKPFRFDLEAPPERLIRPPLETAAGEVFIPVVVQGGRELRLIRFQSSYDATEVTPGREVDRLRLSAVPVAARAAIQPSTLGDAISLLLVEESSRGLALHHVRASVGRITRTASTTVRGLRALPGSEPDLWIDARGLVHAAFVAQATDSSREAVLVQACFRQDGRLESPAKMKRLGPLPAPARAAVARFSVHPYPHRTGELFWAILLEDGRLLDSKTREEPMRPRHPPAVPLELIPVAMDTYVLTMDPARGPTFEPLR